MNARSNAFGSSSAFRARRLNEALRLLGIVGLRFGPAGHIANLIVKTHRSIIIPAIVIRESQARGAPLPSEIRERAGRAYAFAIGVVDALSRWLFSILCTIGIPCVPILIEFMKTDTVDRGSYLLVAAVLAAAFGVPAEHYLFRFGYGILFLITLLLDTVTLSPSVAVIADRYAGSLLLAVAILHASERFRWHVMLRRPFP